MSVLNFVCEIKNAKIDRITLKTEMQKKNPGSNYLKPGDLF